MALPLDEPVPGPPRLLDRGAWEALEPPERARLELVEGVLQVAPAPERVHQRIARHLTDRLREGLPDHWAVEGGLDVVVADDDGHGGPWPTIRRPDVVVYPEARTLEPGALRADEVLLVAEVASPGTRRVDRIAKRADYADAGIRHYLIVEPDPVSITVFRLLAGAYRVVGTGTAAVVVAIAGSAVTLDPRGLLRR